MLVAAGLLEARPMPFVAGADSGFVRVQNPLAEDEAYLRRDVLDTLARRAERARYLRGKLDERAKSEERVEGDP
jgi:hypothetical protein